MTGPLKMSGENEVRFGTDDNYYTAAKQSNGNFVILKDNKGLFLHVGDNFKPYYVDGTNVYRLLTTADNGAIVGWLMPNYAAGVGQSFNTKCQSTGGWVYVRANDGNYGSASFQIYDASSTLLYTMSLKMYYDPAFLFIPIPKNYYYQVNSSLGGTITFFPFKS